MNFIKELMADALNGLSLSQIPFLLFRLFMAGALVYAFVLIVRKKSGDVEASKHYVIAALLAAFMSLISAYALPLAILCIPVLLIMVPFNDLKSLNQRILLALCLSVGLACGAGHVFLSLLFILVATPVVLLNKN